MNAITLESNGVARCRRFDVHTCRVVSRAVLIFGENGAGTIFRHACRCGNVRDDVVDELGLTSAGEWRDEP